MAAEHGVFQPTATSAARKRASHTPLETKSHAGSGRTAASSPSQVGICSADGRTEVSSATIIASPRKNVIVPSVAMKGTTRRRQQACHLAVRTTCPCQRPSRSPARPCGPYWAQTAASRVGGERPIGVFYVCNGLLQMIDPSLVDRGGRWTCIEVCSNCASLICSSSINRARPPINFRLCSIGNWRVVPYGRVAQRSFADLNRAKAAGTF